LLEGIYQSHGGVSGAWKKGPELSVDGAAFMPFSGEKTAWQIDGLIKVMAGRGWRPDEGRGLWMGAE